ncbi:hypothetical protein IFM51744_09095 [Aspergillus udagawae]|nr:hypothetical protein IFM51744_09095 [Aspergillus udagawae]
MLGSSWSLATTAVEVEVKPDSTQPDTADEKTSRKLAETCWRRLEVAQIGSPEIIRCLFRFGLCSRTFAAAAGVNVHSPETPETLSYLAWTWRPYTAQSSDASRIALDLTHESQEYFRLVRFEDWVEETILESYSDPFVFRAIENACDCVRERKYSDFGIDARFIIEPLKKVLDDDKPIHLILHQLGALAVRFQSWYSSPEVDWLQCFNTRTDFLDSLYSMKPRSLAIKLSKVDASIFWDLNVHEITKGSGVVLSALNTRAFSSA